MSYRRNQFIYLVLISTIFAYISNIANGSIPAWTWGTESSRRWVPDSTSYDQVLSLPDSALPHGILITFVFDKLSSWTFSRHLGAFSSDPSHSIGATELFNILDTSAWHEWTLQFKSSQFRTAPITHKITTTSTDGPSNWPLCKFNACDVLKIARDASDITAVHQYLNKISNDQSNILIVPLNATMLEQELQYIAKISQLLASATASKSVPVTFMLTALQNDNAQHNTVFTGNKHNPRKLQENQDDKYVIRLTPDIFTGLVIMGSLAIAAALGVACLHTIQTPTRQHTQPLGVGKEY